MTKSKSGRQSLRDYEITNLLFFLCVIVALGLMVSIVFHYYGAPKDDDVDGSEKGVISESLSTGSDVGVFYLGTKVSEASHQYRSRLEIPVTDDGLVRDLFAIPGVESVTIDQKMIMLKKTPSASWESIQPGVREIIRNHLHMHY